MLLDLDISGQPLWAAIRTLGVFGNNSLKYWRLCDDHETLILCFISGHSCNVSMRGTLSDWKRDSPRIQLV